MEKRNLSKSDVSLFKKNTFFPKLKTFLQDISFASSFTFYPILLASLSFTSPVCGAKWRAGAGTGASKGAGARAGSAARKGAEVEAWAGEGEGRSERKIVKEREGPTYYFHLLLLLPLCQAQGTPLDSKTGEPETSGW